MKPYVIMLVACIANGTTYAMDGKHDDTVLNFELNSESTIAASPENNTIQQLLEQLTHAEKQLALMIKADNAPISAESSVSDSQKSAPQDLQPSTLPVAHTVNNPDQLSPTSPLNYDAEIQQLLTNPARSYHRRSSNGLCGCMTNVMTLMCNIFSLCSYLSNPDRTDNS